MGEAEVKEGLEWILDENTCNISTKVAEVARGALEIMESQDKQIDYWMREAIKNASELGEMKMKLTSFIRGNRKGEEI